MAVCGVDTNGDAVLGAFNEEAAILHAEGHAPRLVLTERGNAGRKAEHVEQTLVGIYLAVTIADGLSLGEFVLSSFS